MALVPSVGVAIYGGYFARQGRYDLTAYAIGALVIAALGAWRRRKKRASDVPSTGRRC